MVRWRQRERGRPSLLVGQRADAHGARQGDRAPRPGTGHPALSEPARWPGAGRAGTPAGLLRGEPGGRAGDPRAFLRVPQRNLLAVDREGGLREASQRASRGLRLGNGYGRSFDQRDPARDENRRHWTRSAVRQLPGSLIEQRAPPPCPRGRLGVAWRRSSGGEGGADASGSKPTKAKVEAKLPVTGKSRENEGSEVGDLERRLAEALKREVEARNSRRRRRDPARHLELPDRRPAGVRGGVDERCPSVRCPRCLNLPGRR